MTYSIREGIEELRGKLKAEEAIAERYPDAYLGELPDGTKVWVSEAVKPNDVLLVVGKEDAFFCPFEMISGMRVHTTPWHTKRAGIFFLDLREKHRELHAELVKAVLSR